MLSAKKIFSQTKESVLFRISHSVTSVETRTYVKQQLEQKFEYYES